MPKPDVALRANSAYLRPGLWSELLHPTLLAFEAKTNETLSENTAAQLAVSIYPTLVLMILWHLEFAPNQELPPWMFVYGVIYTETGFSIYAHYPFWGKEGWCFRTRLLTQAFRNTFKERTGQFLRVTALAAMLSIRSHSTFLLERFHEWECGHVAFQYLKGLSTPAHLKKHKYPRLHI